MRLLRPKNVFYLPASGIVHPVPVIFSNGSAVLPGLIFVRTQLTYGGIFAPREMHTAASVEGDISKPGTSAAINATMCSLIEESS